jgi:transcriptional regulator GlxA family with amidase domain
MRSIVPIPSPASILRVAVLLGPDSSSAMALLFRTVFERANRSHGQPRYRVELVSAGAGRQPATAEVEIHTRRPRGRYDYLVVTPYEGIDTAWRPDSADVALVRSQHGQGSIVASACLGALTLAEAGVLEGIEATTHWSWTTDARSRYPTVLWNTRRIICDQGRVITAGGYLATVDLALHIVAATGSPELARTIGRMMLADSARQNQSVYALRLTEPPAAPDELSDMDGWIERSLRHGPTAADMAKHCNMSLRSFHRKFRDAYGVTPRKYLQLKRVEAVRRLLGESRRSMEQILTDVGVSDVTSFRRIFQRELGCSPAEFRRRLRG